MTRTGLEINGHPLPAALVDAVTAGRWRAPNRWAGWRAFGGRPSEVHLYGTVEDLERENRGWPAIAATVFPGAPDARHPPGDLDPERSVVIGDRGPDRPLALDLRTDPPTVVRFRDHPRPGWSVVATSVEELLRRW
ncbi:MAG TPA: hypothetical protein VIL36_14680 [Acidimicrobiales bacterium]